MTYAPQGRQAQGLTALADVTLEIRAGEFVPLLGPSGRTLTIQAEPDALESFRISLSVASQRTIARALDLLGVSAPESM